MEFIALRFFFSTFFGFAAILDFVAGFIPSVISRIASI
jgi:hypothetical protein